MYTRLTLLAEAKLDGILFDRIKDSKDVMLYIQYVRYDACLIVEWLLNEPAVTR